MTGSFAYINCNNDNCNNVILKLSEETSSIEFPNMNITSTLHYVQIWIKEGKTKQSQKTNTKQTPTNARKNEKSPKKKKKKKRKEKIRTKHISLFLGWTLQESPWIIRESWHEWDRKRPAQEPWPPETGVGVRRNGAEGRRTWPPRNRDRWRGWMEGIRKRR